MPDALPVTTKDDAIIVEGLFVFLQDGDWAQVGQAMDLKIFLRVPLEVAREHASTRKMVTNNISRTRGLTLALIRR